MVVHVIFVICGFLLDEILTVLFPNSYLVANLMFISNIGFCAMILTVRKFSRIDSCLFAFGMGMIYDFCFANTFLIYAVIFTIVTWLLQIWSKHLTDTLIESIILCIVTVFVKDVLVYWYLDFLKITAIPFSLWVERYELLTLLANGILAVLIVFLIHVKDDYLDLKAQRVRKGEKIEWYRLKSKE